MASGKSTIGRLLANELDIKFYDLDSVIEKEVGLSIANIFKKKGELFFRKTETKVLNILLNSKEDFILATGGGTPCYGTNMELIENNATYSFYLKLGIPLLLNRIIKEKAARPIVSNLSDDNLPEFIGKHLFERSPFYSKAGQIITCDSKTTGEIVAEIQSFLF